MKLQEHHIRWLEQNDGDYEIIPCRLYWTDSENIKRQNKLRIVFKSTEFSFNPNGLADGIDTVIKLYPESLKD